MRNSRRPRGKIIALEGPSGVGKTTVGRELATRLGAVFLPEAVDSMRPAPSLDFRSLPQLRRLELMLIEWDAERYCAARRTIARGRDVVSDTGFFGPLTYSVGLAHWNRRWDVVRPVLVRTVDHVSKGSLGLPDISFYLDADAPTLRRRAAADPIWHPAPLTRRHLSVAPLERRYWAESGCGRFSAVDAGGPLETVLKVLVRRCRRTRTIPAIGRAEPLTEALSFASGALRRSN